MGVLLKMALCVTGLLTMSQQATAQNLRGVSPSRLPAEGADILASIRDEKALSKDIESKLAKLIEDFTKSFA